MKNVAISSFVVGCAIAAAVTNAPAAASEPSPEARLLAAGCVACHGTQGRAQAGASVLAGLSEDYFITQMQAFKSGQRTATVMNQLAKGYAEADIAILARYFAAQSR